jgi:tripartite-type tricarboxylate transporter receptor subunit TctC
VPYAGELAANDDDRRMIEIAAVPLKLGRPVAAPPGVAADRVAALKKGLEQSFKDPGYLKDCRQQKLDCSAPVTGEELSAVIGRAYSAPESVRTRLIAIYQAGRQKKSKQ